MRYWITADTHFGHDNLVKWCDRPEGFTDKIKQNLKDHIKEGDLLIHLCDVCMGKDQKHNEFFKELKCRTILILGNHDNKNLGWYFAHGWDVVCNTMHVKLFGKRIAFSHTPLKDNGDFDVNIHGHFHNQLPRLLKKDWAVEGEEERNKYDLSVLTDKHRLVALEYTDYKPVDLYKFLMKKGYAKTPLKT